MTWDETHAAVIRRLEREFAAAGADTSPLHEIALFGRDPRNVGRAILTAAGLRPKLKAELFIPKCTCFPCPGECGPRGGNPAHDGYCCEECRVTGGRVHSRECAFLGFDDGCPPRTLEEWQEIANA